jgi:hypothetical protein
MVDSVVAGTFLCRFILSRQIDGDEPRRLVPSPLSGAHLRLFWWSFFPATTEQHIARVYLFRIPSVSLHLMAIIALVTVV